MRGIGYKQLRLKQLSFLAQAAGGGSLFQNKVAAKRIHTFSYPLSSKCEITFTELSRVPRVEIQIFILNEFSPTFTHDSMAEEFALDRDDITRKELTLLLLKDSNRREWLEPKGREYRNLANKLLDLYEKLTQHREMRPNLKQPNTSPPVSKNRVYFMWDYISETLVSAIA